MEETFGRYWLLGRLGEGGTAEVFKAKSFGVEGFEKVLCIKRILPELTAHERFVQMFVHEAKLAVRLSHANIVQVFDLGRVEGEAGAPPRYFIAMEYVSGFDLSTLLLRARRANRPIPFAMAVFIATEVAKALDHAHRKRDDQFRPLGIVHRDISPQNVLLSWEGEVKVADFGIAKANDSLASDEVHDERLGRVRGKLAYMSPEQARADEVDARSDLFSLGVVLYELIANTHPFRAKLATETLRRIQASEFPPLGLLRPDVPEALANIVGRALAARPEDRFESAAKLHDELLGYVYASADRFGANNLAEFLAPLRELERAGDVEAGAGLDAAIAMVERTPIEVRRTGEVSAVEVGGERRDVTAMVLIAERGEGVDEAVRAALARNGATIVSDGGVQLDAVFGLGEADGRDTEAAVRAALTALRVSGRSMSAGVHAGAVMIDGAGVMLKDERFTSLMAAAQSLARVTRSRVSVSPGAERLVRELFVIERLIEPLIATDSASQEAWAVISERSEAVGQGRFLGRHAELRRLGTILAQATRRRAQLAVVRGEKGLGKTRLLREIGRRLVKGNHNVGYYRAACPKNGAAVAWSGLTVMLEVLCGVRDEASPARLDGVLPRLRALGLQGEECAVLLHRIGSREPGVSENFPNPDSLLRQAFAKMIGRLCEDRLHVFVWDDADSLDEATRGAIIACAERYASSGLRAVFLLAMGGAPALTSEHLATHEVQLGELSEEEASRLIAARTGASLLSPELLSFCRGRAGGNPRFIEELMRELSDSGALIAKDGSVALSLERATAVPRPLRTLIAARMARLDPTERLALEMSAIVGDPVSTEVVESMLLEHERSKGSAPESAMVASAIESAMVASAIESAMVASAIDALARRDWLHLLDARRARFASPMHAEIVVDSMPGERREQLHALAARAYLAAGDGNARVVAEHLVLANDRDGAALQFAREAASHLASNDFEASNRMLLRAFKLCDISTHRVGELLEWLTLLAKGVSRSREADGIPEVSASVIRRIDEVGSIDERLVARIESARALGACHHFELAFVHLGEVESLIAAHPGSHLDLHRRALETELETANRRGDFARGADAATRLDALGGPRTLSILLAAAWARAATGDMAASFAAIDRAESLSEPGDLIAATEREKIRVGAYVYARDFGKAVLAAGRAVEAARSAGLRYEAAASLHNVGDALRHLGDLPRAYASFTESLEMAEASGHERLAALNRAHLAHLDALRGDDRAEGRIRRHIAYATSRGYLHDALEGRFLLAKVLHHIGQVDEAEREMASVRDDAIAYGDRLLADDASEPLSSPAPSPPPRTADAVAACAPSTAPGVAPSSGSELS